MRTSELGRGCYVASIHCSEVCRMCEVVYLPGLAHGDI